jgi:hypothetical protein
MYFICSDGVLNQMFFVAGIVLTLNILGVAEIVDELSNK